MWDSLSPSAPTPTHSHVHILSTKERGRKEGGKEGGKGEGGRIDLYEEIGGRKKKAFLKISFLVFKFIREEIILIFLLTWTPFPLSYVFSSSLKGNKMEGKPSPAFFTWLYFSSMISPFQ